MRGKEIIRVTRPLQTRITPAHAGKRVLRKLPMLGIEDHPRACGEKQTFDFAFVEEHGSPPRMRGKGTAVTAADWASRITPAHAGKSNLQKTRDIATQDHPRACGEKTWMTQTKPNILGSPPRMRGKGIFNFFCPLSMRITPAHAGKRLKRSRITDCFRCVPLHFRLVSHKLSASNGSRAPPGAPPCLPAQNAAPVQAVYNWTGPVFFAVQ